MMKVVKKKIDKGLLFVFLHFVNKYVWLKIDKCVQYLKSFQQF